MFRSFHFFLLLSVTLMFAGCGVFEKKLDVSRLNCPQVGLLHEAEDAYTFSKDGKEQAYVVLQDFSGGCFFENGDKTSVTVEAKLVFYAERNPEVSSLKEHGFKYFVTILSPEEKVLAKKVFSATVVLDDNAGVLTEEVEQIIPLAKLESAGFYKIVFGIQLTAEQLQQKQISHR